MIQANCEACGKTWRLPNRHRAYPCKDCGGTVDPRPHCHACGRRRSEIDAFCQSCGAEAENDDFVADLNQAPSRRPGRSHGRQEASAAADIDRHLALREFGRHRKTLRAMQIYLGFCAGIYAILLVLSLIGFAAGELPGWILVIVAAITGLYVTATIRVSQQPLLWTLSSAALQTVNTAISLIQGEFNLFAVAMTVMIWGVVFPAARMEKIFREFPDLLERRRRSGRSGNHVPLASEARRARQHQAKKKERNIALGILAAVAAVVVIAVSLATADPSLSDQVESFEAAWNDGDVDAVLKHCDPAASATFQRRIEDSLEKRGWLKNRPRLGSGTIDRENDKYPQVRYQLDDGTLELSFVLRDEAWVLKSLKFPDAHPTEPIEPALDRFTDAWNQNDTETLGLLFKSEEKAAAIARTCARWIEEVAAQHGSAKIMSRSIVDRGNGLMQVEFSLGAVVLKTKWEWQYPVWRFRSASAPK